MYFFDRRKKIQKKIHNLLQTAKNPKAMFAGSWKWILRKRKISKRKFGKNKRNK